MKQTKTTNTLKIFLLIYKNNSIVCLGKIKKTHGVKGAVSIVSFGELLFTLESDFPIGLYCSSQQPQDGFLIEAKFFENVHISVLFKKNIILYHK